MENKLLGRNTDIFEISCNTPHYPEYSVKEGSILDKVIYNMMQDRELLFTVMCGLDVRILKWLPKEYSSKLKNALDGTFPAKEGEYWCATTMRRNEWVTNRINTLIKIATKLLLNSGVQEALEQHLRKYGWPIRYADTGARQHLDGYLRDILRHNYENNRIKYSLRRVNIVSKMED